MYNDVFELLRCCVGVVRGRFKLFFLSPLASQVSQLSSLRFFFRIVLGCVSLVYPIFRCSNSFCYSFCLRLFWVVSVCMFLSTVVKVSFALQVVLVFREVMQDCCK